MRRDDLTYPSIVTMLNDHAEEIAFDCLSSARTEGPRVYGDCGGKASVVIRGANRGLVGFWQGQRDKQGGNLIHLIEIANGMTHGEAVRYAKQKYLGISDRPFTEEEKREFGRRQKELERRQDALRREEERQRRRKEDDVREIWNQCVAVEGTPAGAYLERRIGDFPWPPSLRFHRELKCEAAKDAGLQWEWPALVAAVQAADRRLIAIWRIFLRPDGTNLVVNGAKVKMGLGPAAGGCVRFGPVGDVWSVGEGIESTLGAMAFHGFGGSWAATLSTSGMRGLEIPPVVKSLRIFVDQDRPRLPKDGSTKLLPSPGKSAAEALQARAGIPCSIHEPFAEGDDWCDVWTTKRRRDLEE
jgi:hypothetical protein